MHGIKSVHMLLAISLYHKTHGTYENGGVSLDFRQTFTLPNQLLNCKPDDGWVGPAV